MMPLRVRTFLFGMCSNENGTISDETWISVSSAWYHLYARDDPEHYKDRYLNNAVRDGIVFG